MKRDKDTEVEEKPDLSRSQFYLIIVSVLVIVVLGFALVRLLKKGPEPEQKPEAASATSPAQQILTPPPVPKEAITSLDKTAPVAPVAPKKAEAPPAPPAPAVTKAPPPAPAPKAVTPATPPQKEAPKTAAPTKGGLDAAPAPKAEAPVKERPKVKTAKEVRRIKAKPLHKKGAEAKVKKSKPAAEHARAKAHEPAKPAPPVNEAEKLSNKPNEGSFVSEAVKPPPEPFAPVTPTATAAPTPAPEAKPEKQKPEASPAPEVTKTTKPEFTLLVKTFKGEAEAKDYAQELKKKGHKVLMMKKETTKFTWYQVFAGEFADRDAAEKAADDFWEKEDVRASVQPYPKQ